MPSNFIEMDFDEWCDTYKPITNHLDTNASFDGAMFETYGDELDFVRNEDSDFVWTYGDGDDGGGYIWSGAHLVNRIGYFITEVPCPPDTIVQIKVDSPYYYCDNCDTEWEDIDNLIRDKFEQHDLAKCPSCATIEEIRMMEMK